MVIFLEKYKNSLSKGVNILFGQPVHIYSRCETIILTFCFRPYDGKWSKSMVGFGPEDDHFVMELTYNYGIGEYKLGNDYQVSSMTAAF